MLKFVASRGWLVSAEFSAENLVEVHVFRALTGLFMLGLKRNSGYIEYATNILLLGLE